MLPLNIQKPGLGFTINFPPPTNDTAPNIIDLFRARNPHTHQWTRPKNKRLLHSQSRIDLILPSIPFISTFNPPKTFIDISISSTDHHPVTSTINIPTNPLNLYHIPHAEIYYRPLGRQELQNFVKLLTPLNTWAETHATALLSTSTETIVNVLDSILASMVNAFKEVPHQGCGLFPSCVAYCDWVCRSLGLHFKFGKEHDSNKRQGSFAA